MNELYWIGRIGVLHDFCIGVLMISSLIILGFLIAIMMDNTNLEGKKLMTTKSRRLFKGAIAALLLGISGVIFIPSQYEAYAIYGIRTIIDYVQDNQTAQSIPDEAIKVIDKYLEQYNEKGGDK